MIIEPTSTDISLLLCLNGDAGAVVDSLMYYASAKLTWIPLYALLLWAVWKKEGTRNSIRFVVVLSLMILVADQGANLAKTFLPKFRPTHTTELEGLIHTVNGYKGGLYGTVSSHAANCFALCVLCSMVLRRRWIWISLIGWAIVVSYSRIYLAVHFPYDVALGAIFGTCVGFAAYFGYKKTEKLWTK